MARLMMVKSVDDVGNKVKAKKKRAPKKKKHARFLDLECRAELDDMIFHGMSMPDIAKWLHEEKSECTDMARDSLVVVLSRYRNDLPPARRSGELLPRAARKASLEIERGVDELEWLEKLFKKQMDRIDIGGSFEQKTRILNRHMNQEIALAAALLQKRHDIKMDLGLDGGRNLGTLGVRPELGEDIAERYGEQIALRMRDPNSTGKALAIAESLLRLDSMRDEDVN